MRSRKHIIQSFGIPTTKHKDDVRNNVIIRVNGFHGLYKQTCHAYESYWWNKNHDIDEWTYEEMLNEGNTVREILTDPNYVTEISVMKIVNVYPKDQSYALLNKYDNLDVKLNK